MNESTGGQTTAVEGNAMTESLDQVQNGLNVHSSASRTLLVLICQRIARLEETMQHMRSDLDQLHQDTRNGSETVRGEVSGVQDKVITMTSKLKEYENVIEVFQNDMLSHKNHLSVLSSSVKKEIKVVDKVCSPPSPSALSKRLHVRRKWRSIAKTSTIASWS